MLMLLAQAGSIEREWHNQTVLHPLGLAAVIILGIATLTLPRQWCIVPMLVMACFIAPAQRLIVGGMDFTLLRILVLFAWIRLLAWQEWRGFRWHPIDYVIIAWASVKTLAYTVLYADLPSFIFMLGQNYDVVGMYFFFRCVLRGWEDVHRVAIALALLAIPVSIAFIIEKSTGRNAFSVFGGVPAITVIREGKLRAQGAFAHPVIAGVFWASVMPLIAMLLWSRPPRRLLSLIGLGASLFIVIACASSTPVAAVAAGALAACFFPLRHWMSPIRWGALACIVMLHFVMEAPVWHLISRIDLVGGSTGWHRYHLIDAAIRNVGEWALLGTQSTSHWGHQLFDVTNQYVLEGVRGGILTLFLFVAALWLAFRNVGDSWRRARDSHGCYVIWAVGVMLFIHALSFMAVSYFGQCTLVWFLALAMGASLPQWIQTSACMTAEASIERRMPAALRNGGLPAVRPN